MGRFNVSGRRPGGGELIALEIDAPGEDGFFPFRALQKTGYVGADGGGDMDVAGFDAEMVDATTLRFYLVNLRPPVDAALQHTDAAKTGANSTIEVFEYKKGESSMKHLRTVAAPEIISPNKVAALDDGAFVFSNDHSEKVGLVCFASFLIQ